MPWTSLSLILGRSILSPRVLRELSRAEYGRNAVRSVETADLVLYHPEGTISDDDNAFRIMRQLCLPLYASLYLKKPLVIANGTFPLFRDFRRGMLNSVVALSEAAYFRDRQSAKHYGGQFCPDAAFTWTGATVPDDMQRRPYVLITTAAHIPVEIDRTMCRNALDWCRTHSLKPLVMTKAWERLEQFRSETLALGGKFIEYVSLQQADEILNQVRLHVGGRYHMAIFCATKGIPSWLILSNTHKNRWLADELRGITLLDRADVELDDFISDEAIPAPKLITEAIAPLVSLFEGTIAGLIGRLKESSHREITEVDPEALRDARLPSELRAELRRNYFRESGLVLLRATGLRKPPTRHQLPT